jgi:hypothetical protein
MLDDAALFALLHLSDGTDVAGRAVAAATGARYRRLEVDRLEHFEGKVLTWARACRATLLTESRRNLAST